MPRGMLPGMGLNSVGPSGRRLFSVRENPLGGQFGEGSSDGFAGSFGGHGAAGLGVYDHVGLDSAPGLVRKRSTLPGKDSKGGALTSKDRANRQRIDFHRDGSLPENK